MSQRSNTIRFDDDLDAADPTISAATSSRPHVGWLVCFIFAKLTAMAFGQGLKLIPEVSITFWPPAGIFVAALLLNRRRTWPWWIAASCAAELIGNLVWFHNPWPFAFLYFTANAAEAITAALLVRWATGGVSRVFNPRRLETPRNAALFAALAGGVAPVVGATIIASVDQLVGKHHFWTAWQLVWLGDGTGLLLSAPLTLAAVQLWRTRRRISVSRAIELLGTCGAAVLVTWLALRGQLPTVYLMLPALMWAAVRFQIPGAWLVLSAVILTVAGFTHSGVGEFAGPPEELRKRMVALQVFLGVSASSALLVAGLSAMHLLARERLRIANRTLERRVQERTSALRESEERLRLALDAAKAGAWKVNLHTGEFVASERALALHGLSPDACMTHERALACVHPDDRDAVNAAVSRAFHDRQHLNIEHRVLRPDGSIGWVSSQAQLHEEQGERWLIGLVQDVSDRKHLERALLEHRDNLQELVEAKTSELLRAHQRLATKERMAAVGTLAAGLAHDMSNLLLPLGIRLDDLSNGKPLRPNQPPPLVPDEVKQELLVLSALLDHLRDLARNLSLFSRSPSSQGTGESTNLGRWRLQVGKLIDASVGRSITVSWDCPDDLPDAAIAPHRLTQAVQNLIHNARDAILARPASSDQTHRTGAGGRISVVARSADDGAPFVLVTVDDNGVGMSPEVLRRCREPFYTTKDRPGASGSTSIGSGLGLSLAHQVVEQAGGSMQIESVENHGTTITLHIPTARAATGGVIEPKSPVGRSATPEAPC